MSLPTGVVISLLAFLITHGYQRSGTHVYNYSLVRQASNPSPRHCSRSPVARSEYPQECTQLNLNQLVRRMKKPEVVLAPTVNAVVKFPAAYTASPQPTAGPLPGRIPGW